MATRGTAILLKEDKILASVEFNGDMYPHGYGDEFFEGLSKVTDTQGFQDFLDNFNDNNFQYDDEDVIYEYSNEDFYSDRGQARRYIDLGKKRIFSSDWLFFKNLTENIISIEARRGDKWKLTQISPGDTLRFHFDAFPEKGIKYRI